MAQATLVHDRGLRPTVTFGSVSGLPGQVATCAAVPGVALLGQGFTFWAVTTSGQVLDQYPHVPAGDRLVPVTGTAPDPNRWHVMGRSDLEAVQPFAAFASDWFARFGEVRP